MSAPRETIGLLALLSVGVSAPKLSAPVVELMEPVN
jgi:hypothetical protein